MSIFIQVRDRGHSMSVIGFVDNVDVIAFSNQIQGKWSTSTSVCLSSDFAKAAEYIDCFNQTLAKVKEIQKKESEVSDVIKGGVVASANDEQIRVLFDFSVFDKVCPATIQYKGKLYVRDYSIL